MISMFFTWGVLSFPQPNFFNVTYWVDAELVNNTFKAQVATLGCAKESRGLSAKLAEEGPTV